MSYFFSAIQLGNPIQGAGFAEFKSLNCFGQPNQPGIAALALAIAYWFPFCQVIARLTKDSLLGIHLPLKDFQVIDLDRQLMVLLPILGNLKGPVHGPIPFQCRPAPAGPPH